jgi:hypothetical protein
LAILFFSFVGFLAVALLLKKADVTLGDSFRFHERIKFQLFVGPNRVFLTDDQLQGILEGLQFKMPAGLSLELDRASLYEGREVSLTMEGKVNISTNTQPGMQEITVFFPALDMTAKHLGATVIFSNRLYAGSNGVQLLKFYVQPSAE